MKSGLIVSVVDIGSTKVACCIAGISKEGKYSIISAGYCACFGVKSGVIVDAESVSKSIAKAIEIAENAAGLRIKSVYVNVSGKFVRSKIITASMNIGGRLIRRQDITDLLSMCLDKIQSMETIHIIPVMFKLDELNGVNEPVGMFANSLSVNANVVSAPKTQLANIVACLSKCHLDVIGFVHGGYASSLHVMNEDLSTDNQVVIDLGGGTSTINFFYKGVFCGSEVISLGGQNITKDIAYGLKISKSNAERLKTLHGSAFVSYDDDKNSICNAWQKSQKLSKFLKE